MAARNPLSTSRREGANPRAAVRAETPPADHWQRWASNPLRAPEPQPAAAPPAAAAIPAPPVPSAPIATARAAAVASPPDATTAGTASAARAVAIDLPAPGDAPYRVLIVEDDRSQALFAQSVLNGAGMHAQVETASAGVQQAIGQYQPDLILMDLHMPDLDGLRLTSLIRQHPEHQLLPIVFLTGDPDPERQFEVLEGGADDFLTKPIRPRHLIAAVANRIRRARQQAQLGQGEAAPARNNPETGLPTRTHLMQQLDQLLARKSGGALFFVEIASALGLRERFGYAAFERLMLQAGHRLAAAAKPYPLARLNDNSFLVLAEGMDGAQRAPFARDLRSHLSANTVQARESELVHLRCVIGHAGLGDGFDDAGSALEAVERTALAARLDSDGVLAYTLPSAIELQENLKLVEGQLEPSYQPIVAVAGGSTAQYQVLLRLRQADGTLLSAGQVIPAAEAAGRIGDLDQQVVEHAIGLLHLYQHSPQSMRLFVSQSVRTLAREAFADWVLKSLAERGVAGTSLVIDIRLQDALIHAVTLRQFCERVMPAGVQICLSQYEPGAEAAALLGQLPLGYLRLATRFANAHVDTSTRDQLRETIELAHRHGLQVIGQQIEDPQAAAAMWMSGVDFIQGNLVQSVGNELNFDFQHAVL